MFQLKGSFPFFKKVSKISACNEKLWNIIKFIGIVTKIRERLLVTEIIVGKLILS